MKAMGLDALPTIAARDIPTAAAVQMAEIDRSAPDHGVSLDTLMENASRQIARAVRMFLDDAEDAIVAAVAGNGNNGGDALGALGHLAREGVIVDAFLTAPPERLSPLARSRLEYLRGLDVPLTDTTSLDDRALSYRLRARQGVLDGLLGYGARGAPRGEIARMVRLLNALHGRRVIAVDLPSGLDPDGGAADEAVRAALTVTLGLPKSGLLRPAARPFVGQLVLADIGIPSEAFARAGVDARSLFARGDLLRVVF
jgi:NAD(P)H-hydrate epimerase